MNKFTKEHHRLDRIQKFLIKSVANTATFLKNHPNLHISTSDKGSKTIITTKEEYCRKMDDLVGDSHQFQPIDESIKIHRKCENKNNAIAQRWFKLGLINRAEKLRLRTKVSYPPRLFGQIKAHKEGFPIRPIVSTINSPSYSLSRRLASILKEAFSTTKYTIKNSAELKAILRRIKPQPDHTLVSFDVTNCFGTTPVPLAIEMIERNFEKVERVTNIPKSEFINALKFCLNDCNFFSYHNSLYRQNEGLFMGSSLAPILVERVIEHVVQEALNAMNIDPVLWVTYVDDHLAYVPTHLVDTIHEELEKINSNITFTKELESNGTINYLDMTIITGTDHFSTKWYHKAMASNRILNFYSSHPRHVVMNTAKNFIRRVFQLTSKQHHELVTDKIQPILRKNNFPEQFITRNIWKIRKTHNSDLSFINLTADISSISLHRLFESTLSGSDGPNLNNTGRPKRFCGLVYVPGLSESLGKQLEYFIPDVSIASKPPEKISQVFTVTKDKIPLLERSGCVYEITCGQCNKIYIGETIQKLSTRIEQHKYSLTSAQRRAPTNTTALVRHALDYDHNFNFDTPKIKCRENNKRKLQLQEVNHIVMNDNFACNFKEDSDGINASYYNLLKQYCIADGGSTHNSFASPQSPHSETAGSSTHTHT